MAGKGRPRAEELPGFARFCPCSAPKPKQDGFCSRCRFPLRGLVSCPDCRDNELGRPFLSRFQPGVARLTRGTSRPCSACSGLGFVSGGVAGDAYDTRHKSGGPATLGAIRSRAIPRT